MPPYRSAALLLYLADQSDIMLPPLSLDSFHRTSLRPGDWELTMSFPHTSPHNPEHHFLIGKGKKNQGTLSFFPKCFVFTIKPFYSFKDMCFETMSLRGDSILVCLLLLHSFSEKKPVTAYFVKAGNWKMGILGQISVNISKCYPAKANTVCMTGKWNDVSKVIGGTGTAIIYSADKSCAKEIKLYFHPTWNN